MGDTQPRTFKLSPSALLSLPRRLCSPPPSVAKVRSCSATAVVDITLDDVLDRKHLPPLGLKDFEEWLLFVEQNAENLYFILWLREYNARYSQWINNARAILKNDPSHPFQFPPLTKPNRSLAIFYSRAKQTFFTPNSPYELDLPSDVLGPFHAPSLSSEFLYHPPNRDYSASSGPLSPHPDPAVFVQVEDQVRSMLQESLTRFANSTVTNVGTARATCGLVGGTLIALLGFLPPIAENFVLSKNRWLRIIAFPGLWLGLTIVLASLHGVCMMIYIFGDLRQLRSFELVRPRISLPQRLRPLRNNSSSVRLPHPEQDPWLVPITRPPILPHRLHNREKSSSSRPPLPPIPEPVSPSFSSTTGLQADTTNSRVTMSSLCSASFTSCESDASRTPTPSSEEVEIHISEAFYDVEPPHPRDNSMPSSPVPSSWQAESPSNSLIPWIPRRVSFSTDSAPPTSSSSRKFSSPADNVFRASNVRTSTTSDKEREEWIPTAGFIKPFGYSEWEEWDAESLMHTAEGSLDGYGAGDEESRISHFIRPTSLRQGEPRAVRARAPNQFRAGSRRETISSGASQELGAFDFDALPAFQAPASPVVTPAIQRRPRYRTCDASPPPPLHDETSLTEAGRQQGILRTWLVEHPKFFIRRMQGKCGAAKEVIKDVLNRSAAEASKRNGAEDGGEYHDAPEKKNAEQCLSIAGEMRQDRGINDPIIATVPRPLSHLYCMTSNVKEKAKVKENWRFRWKRALSVPAFRSPLTKILSPIVTRAQWEVVVKSAAIAFVASFIVVAILVAVPVP